MIYTDLRIKTVEEAANSVLNAFAIVDKVSLLQYFEYIGLGSKKSFLDAPYLHHQKAVEERINGIAYIKRNVNTVYDTASLNAFSMLVALLEYTGEEPLSPIPATRSLFPYDYILATQKAVFTFINFDNYGEQKIIAHNLSSPKKIISSESNLEMITVITASDGYAAIPIEKYPVDGKAMLARITRTPKDVERSIQFL